MLSLVCVSWKLSGDKGKSDGTCARKRKKSVWRLVCTFVKNDRKTLKSAGVATGVYYKILDIWNSSQGCIGNYWIKRSD